MSDQFNIAVLGPIPKDHITTYKKDIVEKYGCALYTSVVLSTLISEGGRVTPVVNVRIDDKESICKQFEPFPLIDISHINSEANQGDVIYLEYLDQNHRVERQTSFMNPIIPSHIEDLMDCDAFVFVPVTDFEISLSTLQYIKKNSNGVIIFDAHGPTNGCNRHGERFLKFWIDRDEWLPSIDILKMNLEEAACSWYEKEYSKDELDGIGELPLDELPNFARHCLNMGVKALYVTLDEYGCAVYYIDEKGKMQEHFVKRIHIEKVIDTTGCGDSFAGGLAFGYLKSRDYLQACYYGNVAGAQRCTGTELDVYHNLEETEKLILEVYNS
ncbi:MAG: PfkB family carbohydrate kinase [Motiliproteus sp.]